MDENRFESVPLTPLPAVPPPPAPSRRRGWLFAKSRPWINALLFVLTIGSTFVVGTLGLALLYALVLLAILAAHEMGHYLTCRRYGIEATLPFFIPAPTLIGTMGAFIRIKSPISLKRQLFDVGAAGPLAGFVLALPALAVGLALSKIVPALPRESSIFFGDPLLLKVLAGILGKSAPAGYDLVLHPVAFAGWVGTLVTALNLFPIGQLDGGHIATALFGARART